MIEKIIKNIKRIIAIHKMWHSYRNIRQKVDIIDKSLNIIEKCSMVLFENTNDISNIREKCTRLKNRMDQYESYIKEGKYKDAQYIAHYMILEMQAFEKSWREIKYAEKQIS